MNGVKRRRPGVSDAQAVGLIRQLVEIPSPSYDESEVALYLAEFMRGLGFETWVDEAGNAVGRTGRGNGPHVMMLGHMDTAGDQIPVRSVDGALYGRGSVDAKGPLAAMTCAAAAADFAGTITVVGAVEEETPRSRGAVAIRESHPEPDAVIVGEPSGWSSVVIGYKGKLDFRYQVETAATHPTNPLPKASELVVAGWDSVRDLLGPEISHASFDRPGITLTSVTGDPGRAEAEVSIRTPIGFDSEAFLAGFRAANPDGRVSVLNVIPACRMGRSNPVVRGLSQGIRNQQGKPALKVKSGTSDMNTLAKSWSVPMATYGPGDGSLDHSDREHLVLTEYLRGIAVLGDALALLGDELRVEGKVQS